MSSIDARSGGWRLLDAPESGSPEVGARVGPVPLASMAGSAREIFLRYEKLDDGQGGLKEPRNVLRTIANSPQTLAAWMPFMDHARYRLLEFREREIVILRVSRNLGSDYGWGAHQAVCRRNHLLTEHELSVLLQAQPGNCFSPRENALIAAADALVAAGTIPEKEWLALRRAGMTDGDIVDFVMLVGQYATVALVTRALRVPLDADLRGLPRDGSGR